MAYDKIKGILHVIFNFFTCGAPPDTLHQGMHTTLCNVVMPHPIMMSHTNTHDVTYDVIITSLAQPIKGATWHLSGLILVPLSSGEVVVHPGIDVPTFLEPTSKIIDWVVVCYCHEHPHCIIAFTHSGSVL